MCVCVLGGGEAGRSKIDAYKVAWGILCNTWGNYICVHLTEMFFVTLTASVCILLVVYINIYVDNEYHKIIAPLYVKCYLTFHGKVQFLLQIINNAN